MKRKFYSMLLLFMFASFSTYAISDLTFIGDVNGDGMDELVLVNRKGNGGGAIRVLSLTSGVNLAIKDDNTFSGWMDESDRMFLGDVNGDGKKELVLANTSYSYGAVWAIDVMTGADVGYQFHNGQFSNWMDANDKMFLADVNGNGRKELVMINTGLGTAGAIKAIDVVTGANVALVGQTGFVGWLNNPDLRIFFGDVNGNGKEDLISVKTTFTNEEVRVYDVQSGRLISIIPEGYFAGWMDPNDSMFVGDVNGNGRKDLLLVNTNYIGGAIKVVDLLTGRTLNTIYHGSFEGWMDYCDRMFFEDVNADGKDDLVLINTSYEYGAIRAISIMDNNLYLAWLNHGTFQGWMDGGDRVLMGDVNWDGRSDIVFISSDDVLAIRCVDLITQNNLLWIYDRNINPSLAGWVDGKQDESFCAGYDGPGEIPGNKYVYLQGKDFYNNGQKFYPKVMNYIVNICTNDFVDFWVAPHHSFQTNNLGCCADQQSGFDALCRDMEIIASMGFNSVRVAGLGIEATSNFNDDNFYYTYKWNFTTNVSSLKRIYTEDFIPTHLQLTEYVIEAAKRAGLKVILLMEGKYAHREDIKNKFPSYLSIFANHFKANKTLMAYDLYNEPNWNWEVLYSKQILCSRVSNWKNSIKRYAPNHLVTIGLWDYSDVLYWDPELMDVDFLSFHIYPTHESDFGYVSRSLKWISQNITKPWMIGETSYSAFNVGNCNVSGTICSQLGRGSEQQQKQYAEFSFDLTRNCGGSGYSWWIYHDVHHDRDNICSPYDDQDFHGLITRCHRIKPAAEVFQKDGFDVDCCNCPQPNDDIYYGYTEGGRYVTEGVIRNADNEFVKDVVIRGRDINEKLITTFTQPGGYFKIYSDYQLKYLEYSAPGQALARYQPARPFTGMVGILQIPYRISSCATINYNENTARNQQLKPQIDIYPNPANNVINIESNNIPDYKLQLFDLTGIKILSREIINHPVYNLDCSDIPDGVYVIHIIHKEGIENRKIEIIR